MSNEEIKSLLENLAFNEGSFNKFLDPNDSQFELYKDREAELWHDKGWNNALKAVSDKFGIKIDICCL